MNYLKIISDLSKKEYEVHDNTRDVALMVNRIANMAYNSELRSEIYPLWEAISNICDAIVSANRKA